MHIHNDMYGVMQIQKLQYRQRNEDKLMLDYITIMMERKPSIRTRIRKLIRKYKR